MDFEYNHNIEDNKKGPLLCGITDPNFYGRKKDPAQEKEEWFIYDSYLIINHLRSNEPNKMHNILEEQRIIGEKVETAENPLIKWPDKANQMTHYNQHQNMPCLLEISFDLHVITQNLTLKTLDSSRSGVSSSSNTTIAEY